MDSLKLLSKEVREKEQFLEKQTIILYKNVAHVQWKYVEAMKEELLHMRPAWVKLIDLPSFLWHSIGNVAKRLGKVIYTTSISAANKNKVCIMWNISRRFSL
ncbi:hypothetical protein KP509_24G044600 [Ceratopteris richardii]|uniref:Uncharacterized protein n=1 Tax=Ceratopteris richardii TaxID=49495 RepID=A0A8T2RU86_CERRI|nr:hypothetical protein KP509_24G044600 [Ceratopteris richardii]